MYKSSRFKILNIILIVFLLLTSFKPVKAEPFLNKEEEDLIARGEIIKAGSIQGGAPLHYMDSSGQIKGIVVSILDSIGDRTGLIFEYELYDTVEDALNSDCHILFGLSPEYAPKDMVLSKPYLIAETVLVINSRQDPNDLGDKLYGSLKGGEIPQGISEKNTRYFDSREAVLDAVEDGLVDYSYVNEYSVAFYIIQNDYRNIINIPLGKENRVYSVGLLNGDPILMSILNKSIETFDYNKLNSIILAMTSQVERKLTISSLLYAYGSWLILGIAVVFLFLFIAYILTKDAKNKLDVQVKRYNLLAHISNEYLLEYNIGTDKLYYSEESEELFDHEENIEEVRNVFRQIVFDGEYDKKIETISLPMVDGRPGFFKLVSSMICDERNESCYVVGKLIDISEETAEKKLLITKSQIDGLTQVYNPTTCRKLIDNAIKESRRDRKNALLLLDVDNFKKINDMYGHLEGDKVLKDLSNALKKIFRKTDIIGRIGGDEFCIYIENAPSFDFLKDRYYSLNEEIKKTNPKTKPSVSMGVAILTKELNFKDLFIKADVALYEAKRNGGNKIIMYNGEYKDFFKARGNT